MDSGGIVFSIAELKRRKFIEIYPILNVLLSLFAPVITRHAHQVSSLFITNHKSTQGERKYREHRS